MSRWAIHTLLPPLDANFPHEPLFSLCAPDLSSSSFSLGAHISMHFVSLAATLWCPRSLLSVSSLSRLRLPLCPSIHLFSSSWGGLGALRPALLLFTNSPVSRGIIWGVLMGTCTSLGAVCYLRPACVWGWLAFPSELTKNSWAQKVPQHLCGWGTEREGTLGRTARFCSFPFKFRPVLFHLECLHHRLI